MKHYTVDEAIKELNHFKCDIKVTKDNKGNMMAIEFKRQGYTSYIEVIKKENLFKIICTGDYHTYVFGSNWYNHYLNNINPYDLDYNASKLEAGKAYKFDDDQFVKDMNSYFEEYKVKYKHPDVDYVENEHEAYYLINKLQKHDPDIWEVAQYWGYVIEPHFVVWMAIIKMAQDYDKKVK